MPAEMLIIVPTRGRPQAVQRVVDAWDSTGAFECAELCFAFDMDDPKWDEYWQAIDRCDLRPTTFTIPSWMPMVHKLNDAARMFAEHHTYRAIGFAGDDHLPRTKHWAAMYLTALDEMKTGIVYGRDGFQNGNLPTQWAMTSDIVRALGAMVPGGTEHLYCDNIVRDLGREAGCLRYLPEVFIEHMHPAAGKAAVDHGYSTVNAPAQYARDQRSYADWSRYQRAADVAAVRALRGGSAGGE